MTEVRHDRLQNIPQHYRVMHHKKIEQEDEHRGGSGEHMFELATLSVVAAVGDDEMNDRDYRQDADEGDLFAHGVGDGDRHVMEHHAVESVVSAQLQSCSQQDDQRAYLKPAKDRTYDGIDLLLVLFVAHRDTQHEHKDRAPDPGDRSDQVYMKNNISHHRPNYLASAQP